MDARDSEPIGHGSPERLVGSDVVSKEFAMTNKHIKTLGGDHPITVVRNSSRVVVRVAGRVIADTVAAITLREASYRPVQYIPRKDVDMTFLERTNHVTHCPYKGEAAYFSVPLGRVRSSNAAGSDEAP
jgi:uncharacterized protein (DUF427 family)